MCEIEAERAESQEFSLTSTSDLLVSASERSSLLLPVRGRRIDGGFFW